LVSKTRQQTCRSGQYEQGLDIVANNIAVLDGTDVNPTEAQITQGVLDTNIEAALLASGPQNGNNTARLFSTDLLVTGPAFKIQARISTG